MLAQNRQHFARMGNAFGFLLARPFVLHALVLAAFCPLLDFLAAQFAQGYALAAGGLQDLPIFARHDAAQLGVGLFSGAADGLLILRG